MLLGAFEDTVFIVYCMVSKKKLLELIPERYRTSKKVFKATAAIIKRGPGYASAVAQYMALPHTAPLAVLYGLAFSPMVFANWQRTGAITYPGSRYIGPGNKLDEGKPLTKHDRLAYVHDHQYSELMEKGVNPYFTFNEADVQMLRDADFRTIQGAAVALGIGAKRLFRRDRTKVSQPLPWEVQYGGGSIKGRKKR